MATFYNTKQIRNLALLGHGECGNEARVHVHQPEQADPVGLVKNGVAHGFAQGFVSACRRYEGGSYSQSDYDDGDDNYESQFFSFILL